MDALKKEDLDAKWKQVAIQAVTQDDFKKRLVGDPLTVMKEFGLETPKNIKVNIARDKTITLLLPSDSDEALQAEVKWWQWRLNTIREFGQEIQVGVQEIMPETEEGI